MRLVLFAALAGLGYLVWRRFAAQSAGPGGSSATGSAVVGGFHRADGSEASPPPGYTPPDFSKIPRTAPSGSPAIVGGSS